MIILLNGASSSGKTTLGRALQDLWAGPLIYLSLDGVISQLPFRYTGAGSHSSEGFRVAGAEAQVGDHGYRLNKLYADYAVSLCDSGYDVVIDYVFLDAQLLEPFKKGLAAHDVYFIGVKCNEDTIGQRNDARHDRVSGLSISQQSTVHFCEHLYDMELDSSRIKAEDLARRVLALVQ